MSRLGLGFDTGGTYTDAVIMDLDTGEIFERAKSLLLSILLNIHSWHLHRNIVIYSYSESLLTSNIEEDSDKKCRKVAFLRVPVRLGEDAFTSGTISPERRAAISLADGAQHTETLRALIREYTASLGRDISFQRPEEELAAIESVYAPPGGAAVVAMRGGEGIGMACLRRIDSVRCEMKRLYVRREYRSLRLGEALARGIIERARALGYGELLLDTLEDMRAARRLYARLGFSECAPYYDNPLPGTSYMRLALK